MLKVSIVQERGAILEVIRCAEDQYGEIDIMEDYDFNSEQATDYIIERCWLIAFYTDTLKAFVILEWLSISEANIHFCWLEYGPFRKGWKMFLELIEPHCEILNAYIDRDKQSVIKIAERLGFEFKDKTQRYVHGKRILTKATTPTSSTGETTTPTSGTSNS